jgi:hypothetical protein
MKGGKISEEISGSIMSISYAISSFFAKDPEVQPAYTASHTVKTLILILNDVLTKNLNLVYFRVFSPIRATCVNNTIFTIFLVVSSPLCA